MILTVQLAFDGSDPDALMLFWGNALRYDNPNVAMTIEQLREWRKDFPQYDGRGRVDDATARRTPIYIQKVPEPKAGRNRLRPEIAVRDDAITSTIDELRGLGATGTVDDLRDVEGNEFTVVGGLDRPDVDRQLRSIVIDCADPDRMVEFWSQATGYVASGNRCDPPPGSRRAEDGKLVVDGVVVGGTRAHALALNPKADGIVFDLVPGLAFVHSDELKRTKNRLHFDLWNTEPEANRDRLIALGATVQRWDTDHVMLDPEGNEFCAG